MIAPYTSNSICDRCLYLQYGWCCRHGVRRASKSPSCDHWYGYFKADLKKMKQDKAGGEAK